MKSREYKTNPFFLRNQYPVEGKYEFPIIKKEDINLDNLSLVPIAHIKGHVKPHLYQKGVHCFNDDFHFNALYTYPNKYIRRLAKFRFACTPDNSCFLEMHLWKLIEQIGKSRWCGAHWQRHGIKVIPTVTWADPASFDFCFDGIEPKSIVAISTIGAYKNQRRFMYGYDAMLERITPSCIICYDKPLHDMRGNILYVPYQYPRNIATKQLFLPF